MDSRIGAILRRSAQAAVLAAGVMLAAAAPSLANPGGPTFVAAPTSGLPGSTFTFTFSNAITGIAGIDLSVLFPTSLSYVSGSLTEGAGMTSVPGGWDFTPPSVNLSSTGHLDISLSNSGVNDPTTIGNITVFTLQFLAANNAAPGGVTVTLENNPAVYSDVACNPSIGEMCLSPINTQVTINRSTPTSAPEPLTMALLLPGLAGLAAIRRRA